MVTKSGQRIAWCAEKGSVAMFKNKRPRPEATAPEAQSPPQYGRPGKNPTKVSDVLGEKVPGTWQRPVQRPRSSTPASEVLNAHSTRVS
jgi:hypothetical protein